MAINEAGLTAAQLKELKAKLEAKLNSLESEIKELEDDLTLEDNSEQGAPDEVDRSSFEEQAQRAQIVLDGKSNLRYEVMEAIKRIEDGSYGTCEETEEPIGFKRLSAQPWTRLSLEAQQELEQRKKNRVSSGSGGNFPSGFDSDS